MVPVLTPANGLSRAHARGSLLSILRKETILTRLRVTEGGNFIAETMDWESYWRPLWDLGREEALMGLEALHCAWKEHIRSGFAPHLRQELCFRYFSLLDILLDNPNEGPGSPDWAKALQAVLGFECFGISRAIPKSELLGAGTCTLRNPCYLLAKLKMPDALDDPRFLPLITVPRPEKPEMFYHYRQYNLASHSGTSLLLYPAVSEDKRSASFALIDSLITGVSEAVDPRTRQRGRRLFQGVLEPLIQARRLGSSKPFSVEFVDVGAGSGSMTASLCRQIQHLGTSTGFCQNVRLWFVDLQPKDTTRFFRARALRNLIDSVMFVGEDYKDWLSKLSPLPPTNDLRIALVSKLFNNLSRFSLRSLSFVEMPSGLDWTGLSSDMDQHSPSRCLAPDGKGAEALEVSPTIVALRNGRAIAQLSLAGFYRGLCALISPLDFAGSRDNSLFLPVRTLDPRCLETSDGGSVVKRLGENCDYILIEDADLSPNDLVDHMHRFALQDMAVHSLSKALGLVSNHAYLLWSKAKLEPAGIQGERLW